MPETDSLGEPINDPVLFAAPLPHRLRCYPYGFAADIASDSPDVLDAARESWSAFAPRFDRPPIRLHIMVSQGGAQLPPPPVLRGQRHLLLWVADRENFSVIDRLQRFGFACVTRATVADRVFFRWHFLDALIYMLLELNYITSLHGACIAWQGRGVMLYGESGAGKSTLSYACARRGWTYISDDSSSVLWDGGRTVLGEPHHFRFRSDAPDLFPELRGVTVGYQLDHKPTIELLTANLPVRTAPECRVDRIVFLDRRADMPAQLVPLDTQEARARIGREMAVFDPDLDPRRRQVVDIISEAPAFELRYSGYEEAVLLLEQMVRGAEAE